MGLPRALSRTGSKQGMVTGQVWGAGQGEGC